MKSIKKITLVALAAVLSISFATAQVGIQAGYSMSTNVNSEVSLNGFHVGPTYNLTIQGPISLQYGLLYNYLTKKNESFATTKTTTAHRIDLPVRVAASFPFGNGISAFVYGGPNFNFGLSQNSNFGVGSISAYGKNIYTLKKSDDKSLYSPFDLQLGVGGGIQYNNFGVKVGYDWGMLDRDNSDNFVWKNNDLKVGLFFNF